MARCQKIDKKLEHIQEIKVRASIIQFGEKIKDAVTRTWGIIGLDMCNRDDKCTN